MKLIIVGCGRVGSELAHAVCKDGHDVFVIDRDPHAFERLNSEFTGLTILGDARNERVLHRAGIESADGFAALTPNDMMNFVVARAARTMFNVPNVVARVYDPCHYEAFTDAGLQTVISSSWAANRIEQLLTHPGMTELASLGHRDMILVEVRIPPQRAGENIGVLAHEGIAQPVALVRSGQALFVEPNTILEEGDLVAMLVAVSESEHLEDLITRGEL